MGGGEGDTIGGGEGETVNRKEISMKWLVILAAFVALGAASTARADGGYVALRGGTSIDSDISSPLGDLDTSGWHGCVAGGGQIATLYGVNVLGELEACMDRAHTNTLGIPPIASIKGEVTNYSAGPNIILEMPVWVIRPYVGGGMGVNVQCANAETQGLGNFIQVEGCDTGARWKAFAGAEYDVAPRWALGMRYSYEDTLWTDDVNASFLGIIPISGIETGGEHRVSATFKHRF